jgi:beta-glucosidase
MKLNSILLFILILSFEIIRSQTNAQDTTSSNRTNSMPYLNTGLTFRQRADDLVSRMTLEEKVSQMVNNAPAIPRLGIQAYNWSNEGLHGVAFSGIATVFPQVIGMAATWDPKLIHQEADVISTEARAKYNYAISKGEHGEHQGLTYWAPNINIVRDPRWGRNQETYGEDPFLTSKMAVAYITGLQGNDPKYLKIIATPKHFAVHSGPEPLRHKFNAVVSNRDLYETYFPAFKASIQEGKACSVMGAYSALDGIPDCANKFLLTDLLRNKWGFKGYVVSDCGAIGDIFKGHKYVSNSMMAAVKAVEAGCDLECGRKGEFLELAQAVKDGLISEQYIDTAVTRLMLARFELGMFDPPADIPYSKIRIEDNNTTAHRELARKVACESIVILKNKNNLLPLKKNLKSVAVIGAYADNVNVLLGNYYGTPSDPVTLLQGIKNKLKPENVNVSFAPGYNLLEDKIKVDSEKLVLDAVALAKKSDVAIVVAGISSKLEGEQLKVDLPGFVGGDRTSLKLPAEEEALLRRLYATGKSIILVLVGGSAFSINWEEKNLPAIIDVWYPGEEGGDAAADVIFGDYNPAGRLPITFYKSVKDLPPFTDYRMKGRTYRYFTRTSLYPFGFGLSYSSFKYSDLKVSKDLANANDTIAVSVNVKNTGTLDGDEVVQLYVKDLNSHEPELIKSLKGFDRVSIKEGQSKNVSILLSIRNINYYSEKRNEMVVYPGKYELQVGSSSKNIKLKKIITVE